ncbi:hypothetical protein GBAR_LOCUS24600, partial [Geodia barretti]
MALYEILSQMTVFDNVSICFVGDIFHFQNILVLSSTSQISKYERNVGIFYGIQMSLP